MNRYLTPCEIYTSKVFARLRNKTQLFNSKADDHFHTRLMHSIEVEEISLLIASKIEKKLSISLNKKLISNIALLHDIGHTPYGHTGERTLNDLCSGKLHTKLNLPDFEHLDVAIGFKHNINSALLYIESFPYTRILSSVISGIIYHSKLSYEGQEKLDYGIGYIAKKINFKFNFNKIYPSTTEELIVCFADEIAQVSSDIIDLRSGHIDISQICSLPYIKSAMKISNNNTRNQTRIIVNKLINSFVICFCKAPNYEKIKKSAFGKWIDKFDEVRLSIIDSSEKIKHYDEGKAIIIENLFSYYFNNPDIEDKDLIESFIRRLQNLTFNSGELAKTIRSNHDKKYFIRLIEDTRKNVETEISTSLNKNILDDYKRIYKIFIRSIAVYISKMTDGYADNKCSYILSF